VTRRLLPVLALALLAVAEPARAESVGGLERRSKAFYDLLERGQRDRAAATFPDLERALAGEAAALKERMDAMREEVVERDGDLEELYRSPRWREPEIGSLVVAYHLAWVRYQGALLTADAARKKALLRQSVDGFSQFLLVNEVPEIYAESLYGRGLAFLDLGEHAKAIEDLQQAADEPRTAGKAKAALAEARRRATGKREAPENDPETLLGRLGELLPRAAAGDAAAEKDATTLARGLAVRGGTWPARVRGLVAEKLGDGSPASVRSSYGLFLLGQLAVDANRCADVAPLVAASATVDDAGRARHRPELLYLGAGCTLNGGRPREAADAFAALLRDHADSGRAREAAYYRFRALDVARAADPALTAAYEDALRAYLARWGKAESAAEAHYLLGELHRGRNDCARAVAEYDRVSAGAFATRARLGTLECRVASLAAKSAPAERQAVVEALRAFVRDTPARGADEAAVARAALMAGLVALAATPPDHATAADVLADFEQRYPSAKDLHASALGARLRARVALGRLDDAEHDLAGYLRLPADDAERRRTLTAVGRELATRAVHGGGDPTALALARTVWTALADGGSPADRVTLAGLELAGGDAAGARRLYESVLTADPASAEALRGAARAAAAAGDRDAALDYWRRVLDGSAPGGTAWFEARLAQVELLAATERRPQACEIVRSSRGRATTTGADQLEARLTALEPVVCR
jgi:tetratricopeptide (TPR) repeat protein